MEATRSLRSDPMSTLEGRGLPSFAAPLLAEIGDVVSQRLLWIRIELAEDSRQILWASTRVVAGAAFALAGFLLLLVFTSIALARWIGLLNALWAVGLAAALLGALSVAWVVQGEWRKGAWGRKLEGAGSVSRESSEGECQEGGR